MNTTTQKELGPVTYRDYKIVPVFIYNSGRADFEIFHPSDDYGRMVHSATLAEVKTDIDEKLSEQDDAIELEEIKFRINNGMYGRHTLTELVNRKHELERGK